MNTTSGILLLGLVGVAFYFWWQNNTVQNSAGAAAAAATQAAINSGVAPPLTATPVAPPVVPADPSLSGLGALGNTFKIRGAGGWAA